MAYGTSQTIADTSPRDDITRTLLALADPPPGGIHQPPGGIPPAAAQLPTPGGATPAGGVAQATQMPSTQMPGVQMPNAQPAVFGPAAAPTGPMGPIGGPYDPLVKLPTVRV